MQKIIVSVIALFLLSNSAPVAPTRGGDHYRVYINEKVVAESHAGSASSTVLLNVAGEQPDSELKVNYSHCGKKGTNRTLSVLNSSRQVLKVWQFADRDGGPAAVSVQISELRKITAKGGVLELRYAATELKGGQSVIRIQG